MHSVVFVQIAPAYIDMLSKIIEAYEHLGIVSTIDAKAGHAVIRATPDTLDEVLKILANLPFPMEVVRKSIEGAEWL